MRQKVFLTVVSLFMTLFLFSQTLDQSCTTPIGSEQVNSTSSYGQSFKAGITGKLSKFAFLLKDNPGNKQYRFVLFQGVGNTGHLMQTQLFNVTTSTPTGEFAISLTYPAAMVAGITYTAYLALTDNDDQLNIGMSYDDEYPDGNMFNKQFPSIDADLWFKTYVIPQATHLNFDGVDDAVNLGTSLTNYFTDKNSVTLEALVKPSTNTGLGVIVGNYSYPNSNSQMQMLLRKDGNYYTFWIDNGTDWANVSTIANSVAVNTWQHVVGTWDGSTMKIYIDGVLINSLVRYGSFPPRENSFVLGGNSFNESFAGSIEEVRIWDVARTITEINSSKNCELTGFQYGLKANYKFNQGFDGLDNTSTTTVADATSNALHGTLQNFALTGTSSNFLAGSPMISLKAPTASAQSFCGSKTVANLVPAASSKIKWYNVGIGGTALSNSTPLVTGYYYVAEANANGCESDRTYAYVVVGVMPTGVTATLSASSGVAGATFTATATGVNSNTGLTTQWQKYVNDSWTDIAGATSVSNVLTAEIGAGGTITNYRLKVTCTDSEASVYSTTVSYTQYCAAGANYTTYEKIANFTIGTINNNSTSKAGYEDFTSISTTLKQGQQYTFFLTNSYPDGDRIIVWIDFNQNGSFDDAGEQVYISAVAVEQYSTGMITIPISALLGSTRMRVRLTDVGTGPNLTSCGNSNFGQVEDYTIIIGCPVGVWTGTTNMDWNTASNWCDNTVPTASSNVTVDVANPLVISSDVTVASLTVGAAAHVSVTASLEVGDITVTDGQLTIENGASLLQNETAVNTGLVTVIRNSAPLFRQDYVLWSSPVTGQNLRAFSPQTLFNRFRTYDTTLGTNGDYLQEIFTTEDVNTKLFTNAKGYLIRMPNNWVNFGNAQEDGPNFYNGTFRGNVNNGQITIPLSGANVGLNLVGNPYPSPISIEDFFLANTNIERTIYFWRKQGSANTANSSSGYATLNALGFTFADASVSEPTTIQTGQGFFIIANSSTPGNLVFNNTMRLHDNPVFFKNPTISTETNRFWLDLKKESTQVGQTLIGYAAGATNDTDNKFDSNYFGDSPTALTSLINNREYIIQGRSLPFINSDIVPLGFKTDVAGSYTIALSNFDGLFAENQDIFLKDKNTNSLQNLKAASYTFTTEPGVFNSRFEVHYTDALLETNNPIAGNNSILIGVKNQKITINSGSILMEKIELIDVAGRVIYTLEHVNATAATIDNVTASNQMLLVRISTTGNDVVNQKIVY